MSEGAQAQDGPRHYVELFERVDAIKGGGLYRWMVYDSASEGEQRFRWFIHESDARAALKDLEVAA